MERGNRILTRRTVIAAEALLASALVLTSCRGGSTETKIPPSPATTIYVAPPSPDCTSANKRACTAPEPFQTPSSPASVYPPVSSFSR